MKNLLSHLFLLLPMFAFSQPGTLLYKQLIVEYELEEIPDLLDNIGLPSFLVNQNFGIELYKIGYETNSPLGDSIIPASGLVIIPKGVNYEFPIFHYNAGTHPYSENLSDLDNEALALTILAIEGNITMVPDYIGYGDSPIEIPHPYLHEETQAKASVDLLTASLELFDDLEVTINNDLILGGYSQGAHAALATLKSLEIENTSNFTVLGTYTGAGPYHLSGPVIDSVLAGHPIEGYFLPFLIEGYQYMYGDLYSTYQEVYQSPWDSLVPRIFDKSDSLSIEDVSFPNLPIDVLNPDYLLAMQTDSNQAVRMHLKENDLHVGWFPNSKTRLYHCATDNYVPQSSSQNTYNNFLAAGAPDIELIINETPGLTHVDCFTPYLLSLSAFIALHNTHAPIGLNEFGEDAKFKWYSNNNSIYIELKEDVSVPIAIFNILGKRVYSTRANSFLQIPISNLNKGNYLLQIDNSFFKFMK